MCKDLLDGPKVETALQGDAIPAKTALRGDALRLFCRKMPSPRSCLPLHTENLPLICSVEFLDGTQMIKRFGENATIENLKIKAGEHYGLPPESLDYFVIRPHGGDMMMAEDSSIIQSYPADEYGVRRFIITKIAKGIDDLRFLRESEPYRKISFTQDSIMYKNGLQQIEYRHMGEQEVDRTEYYVRLTAFSIGAQVDGPLYFNGHQVRNLITENTPPEVKVTEDFVEQVRNQFNIFQSNAFLRHWMAMTNRRLTLKDCYMIAFEYELNKLPYANCSIWEVLVQTNEFQGGPVDFGIGKDNLLFLDKKNKVVLENIEFGRISGFRPTGHGANQEICYTGIHTNRPKVIVFNAGQWLNEIGFAYAIYQQSFVGRRILSPPD